MLMTKVQKLNEELYEDYINNRKYPTRTFLEKLTKLRREIRKCINQQVCSYCAKPVHLFKGKDIEEPAKKKGLFGRYQSSICA